MADLGFPDSNTNVRIIHGWDNVNDIFTKWNAGHLDILGKHDLFGNRQPSHST